VDHAEAGVDVRTRSQPLVALIVTAAVVVGAVYVRREVGARPLGEGPAAAAPSGAWFCPHGAGPEDWEVVLELANPGDEPVPVRVRDLGARKSVPPKDYMVDPGATFQVPVAAEGREGASMVEYFGGWVAAGWVAHAGGGEGGVAAEPCVPEAGRRWFLPDGATQENDDDYVIVMNPFASDAVFSLTLLTERREPVRTEDWTNVTLKPFRSAAFRLNTKALGETTVSTLVDVSVGRVAAATLGVSKSGGIRTVVGALGAPRTSILPGGFDQGRTDLVVMSAGLDRVGLTGDLSDPDGSQPVAAFTEASPAGESARTITVTTGSPSSIRFAADGEGVAVVRRTYGVASDQGATGGAPAGATAWVVLPAVFGSPAHPGVVLANPGEEPATVTLSVLPGGGASGPDPITIDVPAGRTVQAPKGFVEAAPRSAILAVSTTGTFVPAASSYSRGREGLAAFAVAVGVRIPDVWTPS
jgi:hypothetical protein